MTTKPRVLNYHRDGFPAGAVNIMRPGPWGNPFLIYRDGNRPTILNKYVEWLTLHPDFVAKARRALRGKDLVCCCAPKPCHGEALICIANLPPGETKWRFIRDTISGRYIFLPGA